MSSRGGIGRGISNQPAWMTRVEKPDHADEKRDRGERGEREYGSRDSRDFGGRPSRSGRYDPRYDHGRRRDYRGDDDHRGPPRGDYRTDRRGGGGGGRGPRDRHDVRGGGGIQRGPYFNSYEEECAWVEERRRKRKERPSLFDVQPTEEQIALDELQKAALASHGPNPNVFLRPEKKKGPGGTGPGLTGPSISLQPQQTRHARRLYIGQLSPDISEEDVHQFFQEAIQKAMGTDSISSEDDRDPILSVYINRERHFAFIEFKSTDVCTGCLALNGINMCNRGKVVIKRPNDYNVDIAPPVNSDFIARFDVSRLGIVSPVVSDSPNKIFIGGLPYHLDEDQVMELLSAFGKIKAFHLVKADASATNSKGYCFVEYAEKKARDVAVIGLNGMDMGGGKTLTAKMASARVAGEGVVGIVGVGTVPTMKMNMHSTMQRSSHNGVSIAPGVMRVVDGIDVEEMVDLAMGKSNMAANVPTQINNNVLNIADAALQAVYGPSSVSAAVTNERTRIVVLHNMVSDEDFATIQSYEDLKEEVQGECQKFGSLISMKIPHPKDGFTPSALRKIFLEYASTDMAATAEHELSGRQFGNATVAATFFNESDYANGKLA